MHARSSRSDRTADGGDLPAGDFRAWLAGALQAIRGESSSDVPCDGCTACCTSAQFVHIEPDETATLRAIPPALLFPAPGRPAGHVLMGYDETGRCPMLIDGACSIYDQRPRACRTYDCRVFAAAGLDGEPSDKPAIAARAGRWRFTFPSQQDAAEQAAVAAAAAHLGDPNRGVDAMPKPNSATDLAVLAVQIHMSFIDSQEQGEQSGPDDCPQGRNSRPANSPEVRHLSM